MNHNKEYALRITDVDEMIKIANLLQVDEIHIFDKDSVIYAGSIPEYFGVSMDASVAKLDRFIGIREQYPDAELG